MKICPQCQSTYTDDTLQFCLQDGSPLDSVGTSTERPTLAWNSEAETVLRTNPNQVRIDIQGQTRIQPPAFATNPQADHVDRSRPRSRIWIFALFGIFVLLSTGVLLGAGFWYYSNLRESELVVNPDSNNSGNQGSLLSNSNGQTVENTNANNNSNDELKTPTPKPTLKPAELEAAKKEAESTLYGWKSSAENHNLAANLSNYADTVDYYQAGKVARSKVKISKEPAYKKYDSISIELTNIKVVPDPTGEKATVTFDKEWEFSGVDKNDNDVFNSGKVNQQIILNKIGGKWKIVSEKDLKVYYVDKGNGDELNN